MLRSRITVGLLAATFAFAARASDIYKCVGSEGRTAFQDSPCAGSTTGGKLIVHPNVVVPIDQSASISASQAISDRVSARRRAADDAALRDRMLQEAAAPPPIAQAPQDQAYYYGYAPNAFLPRVKHRTERAPRPENRSHVPVEERKRR